MKMKGIVYILYSKQQDHFYIGSTKDLETRFHYHLIKEFKSSYTSKAGDWEIYHTIETDDIVLARKIESHIKRMKSRVYLKNLKNYPEIAQKLIEKYKS